ncbi:zeta toxin family protein [Rhabdobacter roseus]|uniref:Putative ABC-type ATPase n=1 Tax=Rhabdobacter roseus TaxID=1655419 RepID=A0A840TVY6_9BACT|nr:zeta toxin family protein [Rhabdobacter roseus]MBB5284120.1 putative ABC-type ATPase [Rhabdobacter roseus]
MSVRRLRLFAGPNGSGKSTIKSVIPPNLLGYYLNPDEIEKEVQNRGFYDLRELNLTITREEIISFFEKHPLLNRTEEAHLIDNITLVEGNLINFGDVSFNAYLSAILTDFLRQQFILLKQSFTFESVMSSPDKLRTLAQARACGFRTYLYYVATEDPLINLSRIRHRVRMGGHAVPEEKVIERYYRSLDLLLDAIRLSNRAYIFDNSGDSKVWIAEVAESSSLELKTDQVPAWVKRYILDKL